MEGAFGALGGGRTDGRAAGDQKSRTLVPKKFPGPPSRTLGPKMAPEGQKSCNLGLKTGHEDQKSRTLVPKRPKQAWESLGGQKSRTLVPKKVGGHWRTPGVRTLRPEVPFHGAPQSPVPWC